MTQAELSQATGITPRNIQRWEAGHNAPGAYDLLRLFSALGVTITDVEPPNAPPLALNAEIRQLRDQIQALLEGGKGSVPAQRADRRLREVAAQVGAVAASQEKILESIPEIFAALDTLRAQLQQRATGGSGQPTARRQAP